MNCGPRACTISEPTEFARAWFTPNSFFCAVADGQQDDVVLILPGRRLALGHQRAHHGEGHLLDADHLADRVRAVEQIVDHGLAEQRDFGVGIDVLVGEGRRRSGSRCRG